MRKKKEKTERKFRIEVPIGAVSIMQAGVEIKKSIAEDPTA